MKKILVPTDFSEHAHYALKAAAQIAKANDGEIILLHMLELPTKVIDPVLSGGGDVPEIMFFMKKVKERFEEVKNADFLDGIPVTEAVQFERAFDGIIKASKAHNIDLVVMGSHGTSGVQGLFVGSNTEKVVRTSDIPVFVVKKETNIEDIKNFVFASDFTQEAVKPFNSAVAFAKLFNAKIDLLLVNTPGHFISTKEAQKRIDAFMSNFTIENYSVNVYNDYSVEKGVLNFAKQNGMDLIGLGTHGRTGISHYLNGSIGEDIVNTAKLPVITFKI